MLGRTAANLYWLSRYVERAENVARFLEVGYRMSLTSQRVGVPSDGLLSMLQASSVEVQFLAKYDAPEFQSVLHFLLFDTDNPSSVFSCLTTARNNARAVRASITTDMWETLNTAWLEYSQIRPNQVIGRRLPELLLWVKRVSHQFRGALLGTFLRTPGFAFSQLGNFIERGDSTARILDMKYYVLLPRASLIGGEMDIQQWTFILRAASAHRSYRHVYHDRFKAWNIADYLILRPEMPRSLLFCSRYVVENLNLLKQAYGISGASHELGADLLKMLEGNDMDQIFQEGVHEFLTEFLRLNNQVAESLAEDYNFY